MKQISAALKAHLAQPYQTMCTCWFVTLTNGTVLGFTDHDINITLPNSYTIGGGITYLAASGYTPTNVALASDLSVDNMEVQGVLIAPAITEDDLRAGIWDYAAINIFLVNWADLTMGPMYEMAGHLGKVTIERGTFKAELRSLMQSYAKRLGELTSPTCRANLGDSRCKVNLAPFTVTGTLTGVNVDNQTVYDTSRAESGPGGGVAISNVTNANPGHVTLSAPLAMTPNGPVQISGVLGMDVINTVTLTYNPAADDLSFDLGIDTSNTAVYLPYAGAGTVTPIGDATSGYFDYGVMTFTSGLNNGLSMEVKSYIEGQWTLQEAMPYAIAIGDAYSMVAGCNKQRTTCRDRFSNILNMRAEPFLPGIDQLSQIGTK